MLDKLQKRAAQILADTHVCTVATTGPAGIQASMAPCVAQGTALYLLIPNTSDHLVNLEVAPEIAVTTQDWHLYGLATLVSNHSELFAAEKSQWHTVVLVAPVRLHILADAATGAHAETIDFDQGLN